MAEISVLLFLILVANGTPVLMSYWFAGKMSLPVDFGCQLKDKQPVFGSSKTWRGLNSSLLITGIAAVLIGQEFSFGILIATLAMSGDLLSSFIKRRLKKTPSSKMLILDQLPESALPVLFMFSLNHIDLMQVMAIVSAFIIIDIVLSTLLFRLGIRNRPY